MIGRYIDDCTDTQRDRIIEAKDFGDGWEFRDPDNLACRCLVGHAEDWGKDYARDPKKDSGYMYGVSIYLSFPKLMNRFGYNRVVRACKMRAAKRNSVSLLEIMSIK